MSGNLAREQTATVPGGDRATRIAEVRETELPDSIVELAEEYDRRVGDRDTFLWQWIHNLFDAFTLPCVPGEHWETVKETKTVLTMYITVLDDLADCRGDTETFEQARRIPHAPESVRPNAPGVDADVVDFAKSLWSAVKDRLTAAPAYEEYADLLRFDTRQALGAMEYACVLNENRQMANLAESRHYGPFNMVMFPYADIDLMWSPGFDRSELGDLRSLLLELQQMARIGNWVTTWERELYEDDYTAGVVVEALERGIVTPGDDPGAAIDAIRDHDIDGQFEAEWKVRYAEVSKQDYDIGSFDADRLVRGMRTVMDHHVASYGHK
jgi:hypothetical protein